jgi:hypothetical protein
MTLKFHLGNLPTASEMDQVVLDPELQTLLTEYNSLRTESLNAINNRVTIANFTFGALAIILAGLLAQRQPSLATGFVALLFVPQIAKTGLLIWLGEYNRSQRAGKQLRSIEARVNQVLDGSVMRWETSLASTSLHMGYPYIATVLLLLGAGWSSSALGLIFVGAGLARSLSPTAIVWMVGALSAYVLAGESLFAWFFRNKWRQIRRHNAADAIL